MSVWTTKSLDRERNYVIIKHNLPNINNIIMGVKFRASFAVVEKNSKTYNQLKKVPILKNFKEFPLTFLEKLPFVTRSSDIKVVYGVDVYNKYIKEVTKVKEQEEKELEEKKLSDHINGTDKCHFTYVEGPLKGNLCKYPSIKESPSHHCFKHFLYDPKLDIQTTMPVTKEGRAKLSEKILKNIEDHIKAK